LREKKVIANNVIEMNFEKPDDFVFQAGQFVQFLIQDGSKQTPRSYSLSSTPNDETLEFCVKLLENGLASTHISTMNIGDTLTMRGALGRFVYQSGPACFIATGVGLAPIMGMIRHELEVAGNRMPLHLLFGVRTRQDIFWHERLEYLSKKFFNFTYTLTLSQTDNAWGGSHGRVTEHLEKCIDENYQYYLCGSKEMVMDVRSRLTESLIEHTNIHIEIF